MNVFMPEICGTTAALEIWGKYPETKIIFTTGCSKPDVDLLPVKAKGFPTGVLFMPLKPKDLLDKLADLRTKRLDKPQ